MSVVPEKQFTILLADADSSAASSLRALLEAWGYQVELFADGAAAFRRLNSSDPPPLPLACSLAHAHERRRRSRKDRNGQQSRRRRLPAQARQRNGPPCAPPHRRACPAPLSRITGPDGGRSISRLA